MIDIWKVQELHGDIKDLPEQLAEGNGKELRSAFIFGYSSTANSFHHYYTSVGQSQFLLNVYEERVAPMAMTFHKPSTRKLIYKTSTSAEYVDRTSESVVFAIYFAAVISFKLSECLYYVGEEHNTIVERLCFAVQQAPAQAVFLTIPNLAVPQATVLLLTCLHRPEDADFVWTMSAVVLRLARGFNCIVMVTSLG